MMHEVGEAIACNSARRSVSVLLCTTLWGRPSTVGFCCHDFFRAEICEHVAVFDTVGSANLL